LEGIERAVMIGEGEKIFGQRKSLKKWDFGLWISKLTEFGLIMESMIESVKDDE
jgi:hypothetical protein